MRNKQLRELAVCGFEAVRALADQHPERIQRLFLLKTVRVFLVRYVSNLRRKSVCIEVFRMNES